MKEIANDDDDEDSKSNFSLPIVMTRLLTNSCSPMFA